METSSRPLAGIKVVEMSTFVAVPACARILADMGADVIKVEPPAGDNLRYTATNEGRPSDPLEDTSFDLENANKRGLCLNTKTDAGKKIVVDLLARADIFLTNWRPDALERAGLDYETLKKRFPRLVYGCVTGYGDVGPDRNLPGFDFTAFFARGGILGTTYQRGTVPINVVPGMGDHQCGLALTAGILAALFQVRQTGRGEKVSTNLLHTAIYTQGIMVQAAQYAEIGSVYPIDRRRTINPFINSYKTQDDRFIQICMPPYDHFFPIFMKCIDREDLINDDRYAKIADMAAADRSCEMYDIIWAAMLGRTVAEWADILTQADIPFGVAQTWEEVLEDPQAWAIDTFYRMPYANGNERILIRPPIDMQENGLPPYRQSPALGEHGRDILAELGYDAAEIAELEQSKALVVRRR